MNSFVRLDIGMTWPGLERIPQGCHVWHNQTVCPSILSYFVWDGESSALPLWRHPPYLACIMFTLSLQVPPREFIPLNQNKLPMKPDESVNPLFPPPYSHSILFRSVLRIWRESRCVFHISSPFFFFSKWGISSSTHSVCFFLASCCFPVVTPYFESWVMLLAKLAGVWGWCADSRSVESSGIILGRLVGQRLNFKNKVAIKVAYKNIRKHFRSGIIADLHYLSIQKVLD